MEQLIWKKNCDKEKYVYSGYRITFDRSGSWSFDNDLARNVEIFGADNHHLILTIMKISFGSPEKNLVFTKANTKFCLSLHYNTDNSYLLVNGKEIFKFKADNEYVNFPTQFCLRSISNAFSATESKEVSLNANVDDFSIEYNSVDKCEMLSIRKYLKTKNNIK